jgi:hypothetical protein
VRSHRRRLEQQAAQTIGLQHTCRSVPSALISIDQRCTCSLNLRVGGTGVIRMAVMMPPNLPALRSKRLAGAEAGAGTVTLTNICTRSRLSESAGLVIGAERFIGGDRKARAPAAVQMDGA